MSYEIVEKGKCYAIKLRGTTFGHVIEKDSEYTILEANITLPSMESACKVIFEARGFKWELIKIAKEITEEVLNKE